MDSQRIAKAKAKAAAIVLKHKVYSKRLLVASIDRNPVIAHVAVRDMLRSGYLQFQQGAHAVIGRHYVAF